MLKPTVDRVEETMEYDSRVHGLRGDRKRAGSISAMDQKAAREKLENHSYRDSFQGSQSHRYMTSHVCLCVVP